MKRILIILIMLLSLASFAFADIFQLGAVVEYDDTFFDGSFKSEDMALFENYSLGLDMRINIPFFFNIQAIGTYAYDNTPETIDTITEFKHTFDISLIGLFNFDLAFINLGFGAGPMMSINSNFKENYIIGEYGKLYDVKSVNLWDKMKLVYRANVTFTFGSFALGFGYTMPTDFTFDGSVSALEAIPDFEKGRVSVSMMGSFL